MKIKDVISALERFAPLPLQEGWDNAGLQIGLTETDVSGALLCLDVNEDIIDEAMTKGCNLVVSHHPLIFHGLKRISDADLVERSVMKAIKNDIAIVAMHTNLDNARGGVNFRIAHMLGLNGADFFSPVRTADGVEGASGVMGTLQQPMEAKAFVDHVKSVFDVQCAQCNQLLSRPISKVAICGGAGDFLLVDAIKAGADAFITGEMHYHVYAGHEQEIQICVIGHYQSEQYTAHLMKEVIDRECPGIKTIVATTNTNPIVYI